MMGNLVIGFQNNVLTGTLTGTSSTSGGSALRIESDSLGLLADDSGAHLSTDASTTSSLDVSQLQNDQGNAATAWQPTSVTATLTISNVTGGKWRAFGLFRTNLTTAAVVTVQVRNGGSGGTIVYSGTLSALVAGYGQLVVVAPAEVTGDWCQFTISDAGNPDGYLNIPLVYAGTVFQPLSNMSNASLAGYTSGTTKAMLRAGGVISRTDWIARTYDCTFARVRAAEMPTIRAITVAALNGNNLLFVPDPSSSTITQEAVFGTLEPQGGVGYLGLTPDARTFRAIMTERL